MVYDDVVFAYHIKLFFFIKAELEDRLLFLLNSTVVKKIRAKGINFNNIKACLKRYSFSEINFAVIYLKYYIKYKLIYNYKH